MLSITEMLDTCLNWEYATPIAARALLGSWCDSVWFRPLRKEATSTSCVQHGSDQIRCRCTQSLERSLSTGSRTFRPSTRLLKTTRNHYRGSTSGETVRKQWLRLRQFSATRTTWSFAKSGPAKGVAQKDALTNVDEVNIRQSRWGYRNITPPAQILEKGLFFYPKIDSVVKSFFFVEGSPLSITIREMPPFPVKRSKPFAYHCIVKYFAIIDLHIRQS